MSFTIEKLQKNTLALELAYTISDAFGNYSKKTGIPSSLSSYENCSNIVLNLKHKHGFISVDSTLKTINGVLFCNSPKISNVCSIGPIAVMTESQGCGIGKALLKKCLEQKEYLRFYLCVDAINTGATGFYVKNGFKIIDTILGLKYMKKEKLNCEIKGYSFTEIEKIKDRKHLIEYVEKKTGCIFNFISDSGFVCYNERKEIVGVSTGFAAKNFTACENEEVLKAMVSNSMYENGYLLLPVRFQKTAEWCLSNGFKIRKTILRTCKGKHVPEKNVFVPSVGGFFVDFGE